MSADSLRLEGVCKRFGGLTAVVDLTMQVPPASITGLIGPNGAGKTTVVNLITGMLTLSAGRILLGETQIGEIPAEQVARAGVSRTFQNMRLLSEATVLENIVIGFHAQERVGLLGQMLGSPASRRETARIFEQGRALLDRFHMSQFSAYPAGSLSYGHQRRVEIMRALAANPRILLLDEPVAGMNDKEAFELGETFRELADEGIGLLLIEHNTRFVSQLCKQVHVLDAGRVIASGPPDQVMRDPAVISAYLGNKTHASRQ